MTIFVLLLSLTFLSSHHTFTSSIINKYISSICIVYGMEQTTTKIGIIAIIGLVASMNVASIANGQEMSEETQKLTALMSELATTYGYTEVADLTNDGSLVEFRSNGTIFLAEDIASNMTSTYGFELVEFAPAPPISEDSMIIVSMNRSAQ